MEKKFFLSLKKKILKKNYEINELILKILNKNLFITYLLILINIIIYYILFLFPNKIKFFVLSSKKISFSFYNLITNYQIITNFFSHIDFKHILFNMFYLFIFGFIIENKIGKLKFLLYYLFTGIFSSLFQILFLYYTDFNNFYILGASGAIYGLLGIIYVFYPIYKIKIFSKKYCIKFSKFIIYFLFLSIFDLLFKLNLNVGHISHITGILIGIFLGFISKKCFIYKKKLKQK
ncbi:rhomboid family intramembrane serine protease [Candidatus Shikimatogenerans silvanidophilus]|uniref:rhomboid family intramembrane serine protease n=1 Tax=Candidatus Shikimatogenerans silvanidophilus TaxID=2782547 RepID=UPI001BAC1F47|nr:rhomboid family intramembrane serine protease [Candidatus Shikimatogenerans silvanidophilus]